MLLVCLRVFGFPSCFWLHAMLLASRHSVELMRLAVRCAIGFMSCIWLNVICMALCHLRLTLSRSHVPRHTA